jgi:hypothetical protein
LAQGFLELVSHVRTRFLDQELTNIYSEYVNTFNTASEVTTAALFTQPFFCGIQATEGPGVA